MIVNSIAELSSDSLFHDVSNILNTNAYVKYEGLNIASSIKIKTAKYLINGLEEEYGISPIKNTIIESSSGNLGIALSIVCKSKNYKFICVTDPNILEMSEKYMKLYGAEIIKVSTRDENGGFLGTRIKLIKELLEKDKNLIWTNQYASKFNIDAHYNTTAKEIYNLFPELEYLIIGAGTTGTLVGCAKFFREHSPKTKIVAVDNKGSVTFGFPPSKRFIPGLGTSRKPEIFVPDNIYRFMIIPESETITTCNYLLKKYGLFLGGSSGAVFTATIRLINELNKKPSSIVLISPDFGDKYIDTIYNPVWVEEKFGESTLKEAFK